MYTFHSRIGSESAIYSARAKRLSISEPAAGIVSAAEPPVDSVGAAEVLEADFVAVEAVVGKRIVSANHLVANYDVLTLVHGGGGGNSAR